MATNEGKTQDATHRVFPACSAMTCSDNMQSMSYSRHMHIDV